VKQFGSRSFDTLLRTAVRLPAEALARSESWNVWDVASELADRGVEPKAFIAGPLREHVLTLVDFLAGKSRDKASLFLEEVAQYSDAPFATWTVPPKEPSVLVGQEERYVQLLRLEVQRSVIEVTDPACAFATLVYLVQEYPSVTTQMIHWRRMIFFAAETYSIDPRAAHLSEGVRDALADLFMDRDLFPGAED
jgi:hypothetical protein